MASYALKLDLTAAQLASVKRVLMDDLRRAEAEGTTDAVYPTAVRRAHEQLQQYRGESTVKLELTEYEVAAFRLCLVAAIERNERDSAIGSPVDARGLLTKIEVLSIIDGYRQALAAAQADQPR